MVIPVIEVIREENENFSRQENDNFVPNFAAVFKP